MTIYINTRLLRLYEGTLEKQEGGRRQEKVAREERQ